MKTKVLCSIMIMFLAVTNVAAQWVVSDPALTSLTQITAAKEFEQALKDFAVLQKSRDFLNESIDFYKKVNGVIKNSKTVLNVLSRQGKMYELSAKECSRTDIYTPDAYKEYTQVINDIMEENLLSFDLIKTIISSSVQMTDGERLRVILDLDEKTKEGMNKLIDERSRFNTVNDAIKRISALKSKK